MAEEDKLYCGQGNKQNQEQIALTIDAIVRKRGVSRQDVLDAMELVGTDQQKLDNYFHDKENSY